MCPRLGVHPHLEQADPKLQAELDATNKAKLVELDATIKGASVAANTPHCAPISHSPRVYVLFRPPSSVLPPLVSNPARAC